MTTRLLASGSVHPVVPPPRPATAQPTEPPALVATLDNGLVKINMDTYTRKGAHMPNENTRDVTKSHTAKQFVSKLRRLADAITWRND